MIEPRDLEHKPEKHIINEMQLIFSEKRTALSLLRTGITVLLLPLSVLTVLVATSRYYDIAKAWVVAIPLAILCLGLFVLGIYLIIRSAKQIRKSDHAAHLLLKQSKYLSELLDLD
ncbi:MAG: hypothetical protein JSW64_06325 [Candidatus Zixiibacteriota bacterium]|nr:MAG: hypothetical protein JSW64_06325 [candidate division Zixibacteria bacterium]